MNSAIEQPWEDLAKELLADSDAIFANPAVLAVAQKRVHNEGVHDENSASLARFGILMGDWAVRSPMLHKDARHGE